MSPLQWIVLSLFVETFGTLLHQQHGERHVSPHYRDNWHQEHSSQYSHSRHNHDVQRGRHELSLKTRLFKVETSTSRSLTTIKKEPVSGSSTSTRNVHDFHSGENSPGGSRESRHRVSQHLHSTTERRPVVRTEKLTAVAVGEHSGIRAAVYAGFQDHRNTEAEAFPPFQIPTSVTPLYPKPMVGRRVCSRTSAPSPVAHHHRGRQVRLVYTDPSSGVCCPGWTQVTRLSYGCNKPICPMSCQNGGTCTSPGRCTCPQGFTGSLCQIDIDECLTEKPCGQMCRNLIGSYECHCRSGYELQPDRQSCRKNDSDGTAFEARDLQFDFGLVPSTTKRSVFRDTENEVEDREEEREYEIILRRLIKLEKQMAKGKKRDSETSEMNTKLASAIETINEIRHNVQNMQHLQHEIYNMRNKFKQFEVESRKIQHLTNRVIDLESQLRLRCRSGVYGPTNYS